MKSESTRAESSKTETGKAAAKAPGLAERGVVRMDIAIGDLVPDPENRAIDESDEAFATLSDSVRVMGVLVALQVQRRPEGKVQIWDGERRWRAARRAGLATVPCDVWPESTHPRDLALAGVTINEQRQAHSCLAIARRLRAVKNQFAETQEQVAARTGLPVGRVKAYLNLFNASDRLLAFLDQTVVPLNTALELVRFEKACGEVESRRLMDRYQDEPLGCREVEQLRKRHESRRKSEGASKKDPATEGRPSALVARLEAAFRRDPVATRKELEAVAARFGLRIVADAPAAGSSTSA
jgi:ParB family chromosome partitioning protein